MSILYDTISSEAESVELAEEFMSMYRGVEYGGFIYLPEHYKTGDLGFMKGESRWKRYNMKELVYKIRDTRSTMVLPKIWSNFYTTCLMYTQQHTTPGNLTFKSKGKINQILENGKVSDYHGEFTTYYLDWERSERKDVKSFIYSTIADWVGSTVDADKLLDLLASAINPHFSVHRYLLLIGSGRNGKSTLLKMLDKLLKGNVSYVARQAMASGSTTLLDLNGKLANIVFDGQRKFITDSGIEKSIIVGEQIAVRPLYESTAVNVSTNALFIEGLNHEPMSADKSSALQKRLIRFKFVNEYAEDITFEKKMTSDDAIEALFALLIERHVTDDGIAELVAETENMRRSRIEHQVLNDDVFEYVNSKWGSEMSILKELTTGNFDIIDYESFREDYITWRSITFNVKEFSKVAAGKRLSNYFDTRKSVIKKDNKSIRHTTIVNIRYELMEYIHSLYNELKDNNATTD